MDQIFWKKDWKHLDRTEFCLRIEKRLAIDHWVLDGNYSRTQEVKWKHVDTIIWIDYRFSRTLYQAVKRAISRIISQKELWPNTGNRESLIKLFQKDSIVLWTIKTYPSKKARYTQLFTDPSYKHIQFIRLRSPSETEAFLNQLH